MSTLSAVHVRSAVLWGGVLGLVAAGVASARIVLLALGADAHLVNIAAAASFPLLLILYICAGVIVGARTKGARYGALAGVLVGALGAAASGRLEIELVAINPHVQTLLTGLPPLSPSETVIASTIGLAITMLFYGILGNVAGLIAALIGSWLARM